MDLTQTGARLGPSDPLPSPDTSDAIWSPMERSALLFGNVGERPFLSIECHLKADDGKAIRIVRHVPSDPEAKALFALVGNGTVARIPVDSTFRGDRWRWEGELPVDAPEWDALTGSRELIATLPGAGTLELPASDAPARFIANCRDAPLP
jgi:hypothetical protein